MWSGKLKLDFDRSRVYGFGFGRSFPALQISSSILLRLTDRNLVTLETNFMWHLLIVHSKEGIPFTLSKTLGKTFIAIYCT